jgi:hypothetical protein
MCRRHTPPPLFTRSHPYDWEGGPIYVRSTRLPMRFPRNENHCYMVALYAVWYNFVKGRKTPKGLSPANDSGIARSTLVNDRSCEK